MTKKEIEEIESHLDDSQRIYGLVDGKTIVVLEDVIDYLEKQVINKSDNIRSVINSSIVDLIKKYEGNIKSAKMLKKKGTGEFSSVPTNADIKRLDLRIYERQSFIDDLKLLMDDL